LALTCTSWPEIESKQMAPQTELIAVLERVFGAAAHGRAIARSQVA
jgi:hypothetical protein